jgi:hypothetical protein
VVVISILVFVRWNSELNRNNRYLAGKLLNGVSDTSGTAGELFDFDYDKLYVFEPYQSKDEMEKQIGFKSRVLQETVSENMINILFVKDDSPVAYLYGYGSNNVYYIELPIGNYSKSELQETRYRVITNKVGNSSGTEKTYLNYIFEF